MKVVYDGPFARVRVLPVDGPEVEVVRGEAVELPDDTARSLVAAGEWRAADSKKRGGDSPQESHEG